MLKISILGILIIYVGILAGSIIGFKRRKDYINIFKLDIIIIENIKKRRDNNFNNLNSNKNYKKIKIFKFDKYYNK